MALVPLKDAVVHLVNAADDAYITGLQVGDDGRFLMQFGTPTVFAEHVKVWVQPNQVGLVDWWWSETTFTNNVADGQVVDLVTAGSVLDIGWPGAPNRVTADVSPMRVQGRVLWDDGSPTIAPNPLDAALVSLLEADAQFMALCPGGANHLVAPEDVAKPYMVFGLTQPTRDTYTMAGLAFTDLVYGFDVIQEGHSAEQAQSAARRLWALLQDSEVLAPVGWAVMACRRIGYQERLERTEGGLLYQHVQSLFAITIRPA